MDVVKAPTIALDERGTVDDQIIQSFVASFHDGDGFSRLLEQE
jgi:hypothetical protein